MVSTQNQSTAERDGGDDAISDLAGIEPGSPQARLRDERPDAVRFAQGSYSALLEPEDPAGVSRRERELVALRVGILTCAPGVAARHRARLRALGGTDAELAAVERFQDGLSGLSPRETAMLRHTDLLTLQPGASRPEHIAALKAAGLTPRDIVTVSQLIAFMSYEVRILAGLRVLSEEPA